jgi:hypothetical protein
MYDAPAAQSPVPFREAPRPQQPIMYGYAPRYPMSAPSPVSPMLRVAIAVLAAILTVPVLAWGAYVAKRETKSYVVFANGSAEAVDLAIDGAPHGKVSARSSVTIDLVPGDHRVVAGSDRGTFSVPPRGVGDVGFRGLYNIGGKGRLAVVTKYYAVGRAPFDDRVAPIAEGTRFTALPDAMSVDGLAVDRAFPSSISVPQGTRYMAVTRVCHLTARSLDTTVGCAGY